MQIDRLGWASPLKILQHPLLFLFIYVIVLLAKGRILVLLVPKPTTNPILSPRTLDSTFPRPHLHGYLPPPMFSVLGVEHSLWTLGGAAAILFRRIGISGSVLLGAFWSCGVGLSERIRWLCFLGRGGYDLVVAVALREVSKDLRLGDCCFAVENFISMASLGIFVCYRWLI